jgi:hypothetical protein
MPGTGEHREPLLAALDGVVGRRRNVHALHALGVHRDEVHSSYS